MARKERNRQLTRKERKIKRRHKAAPVKLTEEDNAFCWTVAREMTRAPRDKSQDGKIFFLPERGCNDYVGGIALCATCHYNFNNQGCHKMREASL